MPQITITDGKSNPIVVSVTDKSDAIRQVSTRLLTAGSRSSVEKVLNGWLKSSMTNDLRLKLGSETMTIRYED